MTLNRVADFSPANDPRGRDHDELALLRAQDAAEQCFGPPEQILGSRNGTLTLRFPNLPGDLVATLQGLGAFVMSHGLTPAVRGGPAIVPSVIADWNGVTVIARGRVHQASLAGLEVVLAPGEPLASVRGGAVLEFLHDTLNRFPDPDEALVGLVLRCLERRHATSDGEGYRLAGLLLRGIGQSLEQQRPDAADSPT